MNEQINIGNAPKIITIFLVGLIVLVIGSQIFNSMQTTMGSSETLTYNDEMLLGIFNSTSVDLGAANYTYFTSVDTSSVIVWNTSTPETLHSGNYTITSTGTFAFTAAGNLSYGGPPSNISINYTTTNTQLDHNYNITEDSIKGVGEIAGFAPTIGLILAASLILGLLLGGLAYFGKRD